MRQNYCRILACILYFLPATVFAQQTEPVQQPAAASSPYEKVLSVKKDQAVQKAGAVSKRADTVIQSIQDIPKKYIIRIDNKIGKYSDRITSKTEKTLAKLSKWENKIKGLLEKTSPETAQKLFGNGQMSFSSLLQKVRDGKAVADGYKARYNEYRDKIYTSLHYLEDQKDKLNKEVLQPLNQANQKLNSLEQDISNTEAVEAFIKQRKRQLIDEAVKYIGKSKYLTKIDKEAYYYIETLRNYKELFSDPKKAEETALKILNKIPAFKQFTQQNSMLASLFPQSASNGNMPNLAGLQTRAGMQAMIQQRIAAGGPNAGQIISQNVERAQAELTKLKDKILQSGGSNSSDEVPSFRPNNQRTKTFAQRLEYGTNIQFGKANHLLPGTADIALSIGYKINDKSMVGIGASYKMGFGRIDRLSVTHQGIGIRSFIDWKLKKQFYVSGGLELNQNAGFKNIEQLKDYSRWQTAGLIGISKKIDVKTKFFKGTKLQLLFDAFYRNHVPVSQPVLFRVGYNFK